jgi:uncharacterized protein (DUF433 family)
MNIDDFIEIRPGVRTGEPGLEGTHITVSDVLEYMAGGMGQHELLDSLRALSAEPLQAALLFAAAREQRLATMLRRPLAGPPGAVFDAMRCL